VSKVHTFVQGAGRVARASGRLLGDSDRVNNLRSLAQLWTFRDESRVIPELVLSEIFPDIPHVHSSLPRLMKHMWDLPFGERAILDGIVRLLAPQTIFEFGTATGATTVLLADAAPDGAVIHTVDLPEESGPEIGADVVGQEFNGKPQYTSIIVQHRVDLRSFDVAPFRRAVDFIFVDAGHDFDSVTQDSAIAFEMLRPGGCIVWDDYQPIHWETVRALNQVNSSHRLARIAYSRFVLFHDSGQTPT
jgi:hypothetical protein